MSKRRTARKTAGIAYYRRKRSFSRFGVPAAILAGAALAGAAVGVAPSIMPDGTTAGYTETLGGCRVTDGDTIRCGDERIRLLAIDAPEMPGHCRSGRRCAPGDPHASKASLLDAMTGELTINRVGEDHYGRTLAQVAGSKGDLSCWQLEHEQAIYRSDWDNGLRVARTCPGAIM